MSDAPPPSDTPDPTTERERSPLLRVDEILRGFTEDSSLYPILAVVIAIFATLAGAAILLALQRNFAAMGAVAGMAVLSFGATEADRKARRIGPTTGIVLAFWGLSVGGALLVRTYAP